MTARSSAPVHSAWTTPDGLVPCCGEDPRTVGPLTLDPAAVTCTPVVAGKPTKGEEAPTS